MNKIIWLTGLPCSGKTTIAKELSRYIKVEILDGDDIRKIIHNNNFSLEGRKKHMLTIAEMASRFSKHVTVIVALVSPIKEVRDEIKVKYPNVEEVFIDCPVEKCIKRDVKGMYKQAMAGKIKDFTGIDSAYEKPTNDMMIDTDTLDLKQSVDLILDKYFQPEKYSIFIGRYQPLHQGHVKLITTVLDEGKKVCVALRDTKIDDDNPYSLIEREDMLKKEFGNKVKIITVPDIEHVCHGRKVGWGIREVKLDAETEEISATKIREGLNKN